MGIYKPFEIAPFYPGPKGNQSYFNPIDNVVGVFSLPLAPMGREGKGKKQYKENE